MSGSEMHQTKQLLSWAFAVLPLAHASLFAETVKTVKVLTIGNSFADNACCFLQPIVESVPGCKIQIMKANIGGCSLEKHAQLIKACDADPAFKPYQKKYSLKELLRKEKWDVVTLQQVSHFSFCPESYQPFADELFACIKSNAPKAEILIHQTWAYAPDSKRLAGFGMTRQEMNDGLITCYADLSRYFGGLRMLKSGEAFTVSLAANPEIDLWHAKDRFHASKEGCYLAGCVWFAELFGISPERVTYLPTGMKPDVATALRSAAKSIK
jgi:hypothetical protein